MIKNTDPLPEAEIYLAYGRKKQVMQVLETHLRRNPKDGHVRAKLSQLRAQAENGKHTSQSVSRMAPQSLFTILSFNVCLMVTMGGGFLVLWGVVTSLGFDSMLPGQISSWQDGLDILWTTLGIISLAYVLFHVAFAAWLLFAKLFFSRAEILKVLLHRQPTRVQRWLYGVIFSEIK